jgi:hypothetical protein
MKKLFFFVALLAGASFTINAQTVRYVDNNQGAPTAGLNYTTIQAAVDASSPGDIIYVQPSPNTYDNVVNMSKRLNIYGIGYNPELNAGQYAYVPNFYFNGSASDSKISGLYIGNINLSFNVTNHNILITNNRIEQTISGNNSTSLSNNVVISGNFFYHPSTRAIDNNNSQNWMINNNTFSRPNGYWGYDLLYRLNNTTIFNNNIILSRQTGDGSQRVQLFLNCNGTQLSNNIFIFVGNSVADFTSLGSNSALVFNNNLTYGVTSALDPLGGTNIDDQDPQFVSFNPAAELNSTGNDLHLQGSSPGANAGADGFDIGLYNGNFPFNVRGYPTELPYITDFVIFNNILSEGTDLNINVKADANNN